MTEIRVPTLGESVSEATIGRWFKKPGDTVAVDEPLVELETDKVTIEVPAPAAGVLADVAAKDGDTVAVGALLGQIKDGAGAAPAPKTAAPPLEPPAVRVLSTGFRAGGNIGPSVTGRVPNSGAFVFPRMAAPSSFNRPMAKPSSCAIDFSKTSDPRLLR